jgi:hypothetical protein
MAFWVELVWRLLKDWIGGEMLAMVARLVGPGGVLKGPEPAELLAP